MKGLPIIIIIMRPPIVRGPMISPPVMAAVAAINMLPKIRVASPCWAHKSRIKDPKGIHVLHLMVMLCPLFGSRVANQDLFPTT